MKKLAKTLALVLLCGGALFVTSCNNSKGPKKVQEKEKPDTPEANEVKKVSYLDATQYGAWIYFSFAKGAVVEVADAAKSMEWDAAFSRNQFKVNDKAGFAGDAAVAKTTAQSLDAVKDVKGLEFKGNVKAQFQIQGGMGKEKKFEDQYYVTDAKGKSPNSYLLFTLNMKGMGDPKKMYPINKNVFVFKTADGKSYYKLQMVDALNNKGQKGGTLSFNIQKI